MDAPATTEHSPRKNLRLTSPHRLDWAKGHLDTLALISKLREEGVTAHLYIPARSHKREARLLHRAQELEVDDLVHIHGWVSREQMPAYLSSMDWTLSLGEIPEAFGLSVAESLVCATQRWPAQSARSANLLPTATHWCWPMTPTDGPNPSSRNSRRPNSGQRTHTRSPDSSPLPPSGRG